MHLAARGSRHLRRLVRERNLFWGVSGELELLVLSESPVTCHEILLGKYSRAQVAAQSSIKME